MQDLEYYGIFSVQNKGAKAKRKLGGKVSNKSNSVISSKNQFTISCTVLLKVDMRELCTEVDKHPVIEQARSPKAQKEEEAKPVEAVPDALTET